MGGGGGAPAPRDLYTETAGELKAKADLAPKVFATEAQFGPQYDALSLQSLATTLEGTPETTREMEYNETVDGWKNSMTGEFSETKPDWQQGVAGVHGGAPHGDLFNPWRPYQQTVLRKKTVPVAATKGYLDLAGEVSDRADQMQALSQTRQRSADIADVQNLGPASLQAIMAADPAQAHLINQLTEQSDEELALGTRLSPSQMRLVQQSVRAGQAARGMGFSPADNYGEALGVSQFGTDLQNQRRQQAASTIGIRAGIYGDSFNRVLGRPAANNGAGYMSSAYGIDQQSGPKMFGSTINANDVANSNFNAASAKSISDANNSAAMTSAGIGAGVSLAAAGILAA